MQFILQVHIYVHIVHVHDPYLSLFDTGDKIKIPKREREREEGGKWKMREREGAPERERGEGWRENDGKGEREVK